MVAKKWNNFILALGNRTWKGQLTRKHWNMHFIMPFCPRNLQRYGWRQKFYTLQNLECISLIGPHGWHEDSSQSIGGKFTQYHVLLLSLIHLLHIFFCKTFKYVSFHLCILTIHNYLNMTYNVFWSYSFPLSFCLLPHVSWSPYSLNYSPFTFMSCWTCECEGLRVYVCVHKCL